MFKYFLIKMKQTYIKLSLSVFLLLIYVSNAHLLENFNANNNALTTFEETDARFYANFAKMANCALKPLSINCPKCLNPNDGYKFFFYFQTTRMKKFVYKFLIHYNDQEQKIVVSFAGPSVENHEYVKYIYGKGFVFVRNYRAQIESEFYNVYFKRMKPLLAKKLKVAQTSGRKDYKITFVGHSLGGSIATIAAFDMSNLNVIQKPNVYTYGALRFGDAAFVTMINLSVNVFRIVRSNDYIVRIPNCYYSVMFNSWRCFSEPIIRKFIHATTFPLKIYVKKYATYYTATNPVLIKFYRKAQENGVKVPQLSKKVVLKRNTSQIKKTLQKKSTNILTQTRALKKNNPIIKKDNRKINVNINSKLSEYEKKLESLKRNLNSKNVAIRNLDNKKNIKSKVANVKRTAAVQTIKAAQQTTKTLISRVQDTIRKLKTFEKKKEDLLKKKKKC